MVQRAIRAEGLPGIKHQCLKGGLDEDNSGKADLMKRVDGSLEERKKERAALKHYVQLIGKLEYLQFKPKKPLRSENLFTSQQIF